MFCRFLLCGAFLLSNTRRWSWFLLMVTPYWITFICSFVVFLFTFLPFGLESVGCSTIALHVSLRYKIARSQARVSVLSMSVGDTLVFTFNSLHCVHRSHWHFGSYTKTELLPNFMYSLLSDNEIHSLHTNFCFMSLNYLMWSQRNRFLSNLKSVNINFICSSSNTLITWQLYLFYSNNCIKR